MKMPANNLAIDVKDLVRKYSIEELNKAAEELGLSREFHGS